MIFNLSIQSVLRCDPRMEQITEVRIVEKKKNKWE